MISAPEPLLRPLGDLVAGQLADAASHNLQVSGVSLDSRAVAPGELFLALPGRSSHGADHIQDALQNGAVAVLIDSARQSETVWREGVPILPFANLAQQAGLIGARYYGFPSRALWIAGITGTNGKTSCAWWLQQLLNFGGVPSASLGTLGVTRGGQIGAVGGGLTTADAVTLQRELAALVDAGVTAVAMEVSSHGLAQDRVAAVEFDLAVFTNLSQDHLDYHGDYSAYAAAKRRLFEMPGVEQVLLNLDDPMGRELAEQLANRKEVRTYSMAGASADYRVLEFEQQDGLRARVATPRGEIELANRHIFGTFNLANLLAVMGAAVMKGLPLSVAVEAVARLTPVPGRLQCVSSDEDDIRVFVDFAHTPAAITQALRALSHRHGAGLICVLGAGGNRDRGKRPLMTGAAAEIARDIILTSDNPRNESPQQIIEEMAAGMPGGHSADCIVDRAEAISTAILRASPGDIVAILGKGHESYQDVAGQRLPFSDQQVAMDALRVRRGRFA